MSDIFKDVLGDTGFATPEQHPRQGYLPSSTDEPEGMTVGEMWDTARELDSTIGAFQTLSNESQMKPDPNYSAEGRLDDLVADVNDAQKVPLASYVAEHAFSEDHEKYLKSKWLRETEMETKLAEQGWGGLGIRLGVNIFDEGAIALGLATSGVGWAAGSVAKVGRLANAVRIGMYSAAENAALEAYLTKASATRTNADILIAGIGGAVIGGALGSVVGVRRLPDVNGNAGRASRTADELAKAEVADAAGRPPGDHPQNIKDLLDAESPEVQRAAHAEARNHRIREAQADGPSLEAERLKLGARADELRARAADEVPVRGPEVDEGPIVRSKFDELRDNLKAAKTPEETRIADMELQQFKRDFAASRADRFENAIPKTEAVDAEIKKMEDVATEARRVYDEGVARQAEIEAELKGIDAKAEILSKRLGDADTKSMGAAQAGRGDADLTDDDLMDSIHEWEGDNPLPASAYVNADLIPMPGDITNLPVRFDMMANTQRQDGLILKRLGDMLAEDGVGKTNGDVSIISATEITDTDTMNAQYKLMRAFKVNFPKWATRNGYGKHHQYMPEIQDKYWREVSDVVEAGHKGAKDVLPVAAEYTKVVSQVAENARRARLLGADDFRIRDDYVNRSPDFDKVNRLSNEFSNENGSGLGAIEDLVYRSLIREYPELSEEHLMGVAKNYVHKLRAIGAGDGMSMRFADVNNINADTVRELMEEMGVDEDAIAQFTEILSRPDPGKGKLKQHKHRTLLNMETTGMYRNEITGEMEELSIKDLFERNAFKLMNTYVQNVNGWAQISLRTMGTPYHMRNMQDVERLLKLAQREGTEMGTNPKKLQEGVNDIRWFVSRALGRSVAEDPNNKINRGLRFLRDWNFTANMGQVIWAQTAEWGNVVGQNHIMDLMRSLPGFRGMVRNAGTGKFDDTLVAEAEDYLAFGTDHMRHNVSARYDGDTGGGTNVAETTVDKVMERIKGVVAAPMHWLMGVQHRINIGATTRGWAEMATGNRQVKPHHRQRWKDYGLSDEDFDAVLENVRRHATDVDGNPLTAGAKLGRMNYENWDVNISDKLKYGMGRRERRIIQENTIGTTLRSANTNAGQTLFQYRGFIMNAYSKMLLHGVKHHDIETFMSFSASMFFAGAAYVGQTHTKAIGMDDKDRKEYLKKMLTEDRIASAAFARAGFASLMPSAYDTIATMAGFEPQFDVRSSGYKSSFIAGNPTVAMLDRGRNSIEALSGLAHGEQFTKSDWYQLKGLMPMNNLIGVQNMMNLVGNTVPK